MTSMSKYLSVAVAILVAAMIQSRARDAAAGDPDLVYSTIHTEHFNIHFHQGLEEVAREAAAICEEVHETLSIRLGWEVDGPTEVVITDRSDTANGMAMASPRPYIQLYATGPMIDLDASGLSHHSHWLRTLITHEYTHVTHLQMHGGVARVINAIFGDVYLPNQMQPKWFVEGLAVMEETHRTGGGRIRSSTYRMVVRTHALEGTLLTLGEVSNYMSAYPRGHSYYIYGAMFVDYLRTRFGEEKLSEVCELYGSATLPYGLNRVFRKVYGVDLDVLYADWQADLEERSEAAREALEEVGITESRRLTEDGESKGRPVFSPDGSSLIVPISNQRVRAGIFEIPLDGGELRRLAYSSPRSPISIDSMGRIYFTRTAPHRNYYRYFDVFAIDRPGADPRRVTNGARARGAAISPDGRSLVMALNEAGTSRLVLADDRGNARRVLVDSARNDQVYGPSWSPDGKEIAVLLRRDHEVDLFVVDVETGALTRITRDLAIEGTPVYDPSGRYILFASDRSGISNIYAYDLARSRLLQLTNVLGGALAPAVSPDGRSLAFLGYTSEGWDVHLADFDPDNPIALLPADARWGEPKGDPEPDRGEVVPYNPLPSILPRAWTLGFTAGEDQMLVQAVVAMNDAAGLHAVAAELDYGVTDNGLVTRVGYSYYGMAPTLSVGFSRQIVPKDTGYSVGGETRPWDQDLITGSVGLSASIPGLDRSHSLSASYSIIHARPRERLRVDYDPSGELPDLPEEYFRTGLRLGWTFRDLTTSAYGVSPEDGRALGASVSLYHPALGGNQKLAAFRWSWSEYQEAPWLDHHVFALRFTGGVYVTDPPQGASFSAGGYREQNMVDALWNATPMSTPSIRGYAPGSLTGDQLHTLRLEYRFPLWWAEAAYKTIPLFFRRLHAGVFTDNALITYDSLDTDDWYSSVGAELVWSVMFGYFMPITLRTGYARGLMRGGTNEFIFVMGGTF